MRHAGDVLSPPPWLLASDKQLLASSTHPKTPAEVALPAGPSM